jgi:uncharacterized protein (TIGR02466 family)
MKETNIVGIFPTPIYITNLNRNFSKKEIDFINKTKFDTYKNEGNTTSKNTYILNDLIFKKLKQEINLTIKDYFNKIIVTKNNITPYITQSWLNYTETNQHHHKHEHPNSFLSGVLYINAVKEYDKIFFYKKDNYRMINPVVEQWNVYNSNLWWFPVETGQLILFPSSLTHSVETKKGNNTRISLAFNTFVKGAIGNNMELTELML